VKYCRNFLEKISKILDFLKVNYSIIFLLDWKNKSKTKKEIDK